MAKTCIKCSTAKDESEYRIVHVKGRKDWVETRCNACTRVYRRAWQNAKYQRNPDEHKRRTLRRYHQSKSDPLQFMVSRTRTNALQKGVEFAMTVSDITLPIHCPALGIELTRPGGGLKETSPTIDRLDPNIGYVSGNVNVISMRANRFKNNATLAELEAIVTWMRSKGAK